jgi:phosphoglycolate phosphatase-like HAD superfamily hydrolase
MTQLVLWDIDGTLVYAGEIAGDVFDDAIEEVTGLRPKGRIRMSGKTDPEITLEYLEMLGLGDTERCLDEILEALARNLAARRHLITEQGRVLPGVVDAIDAIGAIGGVEQTILTGNLVANARIKLAAFGLDDRFDFAIGAYGSDHRDRRELVPIALDRSRRLRNREIVLDEVLIIGDSPNDLVCARAGGVRCLLVATGRFGIDELAAFEPDYVMADLTDTAAVLRAVQ